MLVINQCGNFNLVCAVPNPGELFFNVSREGGRDKQFTDTGDLVREKYTIEPGVAMYTLVEAFDINFLSHSLDTCGRCNNCNWLLSVELLMARIMTRR
jgi:hypothetical protein